jgi:hypothetical protein
MTSSAAAVASAIYAVATTVPESDLALRNAQYT